MSKKYFLIFSKRKNIKFLEPRMDVNDNMYLTYNDEFKNRMKKNNEKEVEKNVYVNLTKDDLFKMNVPEYYTEEKEVIIDKNSDSDNEIDEDNLEKIHNKKNIKNQIFSHNTDKIKKDTVDENEIKKEKRNLKKEIELKQDKYVMKKLLSSLNLSNLKNEKNENDIKSFNNSNTEVILSNNPDNNNFQKEGINKELIFPTEIKVINTINDSINNDHEELNLNINYGNSNSNLNLEKSNQESQNSKKLNSKASSKNYSKVNMTNLNSLASKKKHIRERMFNYSNKKFFDHKRNLIHKLPVYIEINSYIKSKEIKKQIIKKKILENEFSNLTDENIKGYDSYIRNLEISNIKSINGQKLDKIFMNSPEIKKIFEVNRNNKNIRGLKKEFIALENNTTIKEKLKVFNRSYFQDKYLNLEKINKNLKNIFNVRNSSLESLKNQIVKEVHLPDNYNYQINNKSINKKEKQ